MKNQSKHSAVGGYAAIASELEQFRKYQAAAKERMVRQEKAGQTESAEHSRQAWEFCSKYVSQLEAIMDGAEKRASGKHYFTKDGGERYRAR